MSKLPTIKLEVPLNAILNLDNDDLKAFGPVAIYVVPESGSPYSVFTTDPDAVVTISKEKPNAQAD